MQRILDFAILLINKCAQADEPYEHLDKILPVMNDDESISTPQNLVIHTPSAPFTHARNNVDRRCKHKRYKKKKIIKMKIIVD